MSGQHHGSRFIQHHYDDAQHQFDAGKLGIWVFLAQEVLFFSALFVAYIIYRHQHPEIFYYAHKYLEVKWGATNTVVLLVSSLTAAWAVRAAQLQQRKLLIGCIIVTILCACGFMAIKAHEYAHKFHEGLWFGAKFDPEVDNHGNEFPKDDKGKPIWHAKELAEYYAKQDEAAAKKAAGASAAASSADAEGKTGEAATVETTERVNRETGLAAPASAHDTGHHEAGEEGEGHGGGEARAIPPPPNTNMFFTLYFAMTGLHGIHVMIGIFVFLWLLRRSIRGDFTSDYFGPIDYGALYWHLVDLIWIYLFPLLYLIH